jgi:antitoxin ParD1/3/4
MAYLSSIEREAMERGRLQAVHESIATALRIKFGAAGNKLAGRARKLSDLKQLRALLVVILKAERLGTASDYFRELLREEQKRQGRIHVEAKLQEALDSGAPTTVNATTWRESDKRVQERIKAAARKRRANGATH